MTTRPYLQRSLQSLEKKFPCVFMQKLAILLHVSYSDMLLQKGQIDLIVMGMKGLSGVEKAFLGSVAANVAMHSRFPVMIVPANCQIYPIEHIVDATDLYQDEIEFGAVMQFARLFGAEVSMLHVFASDDAVEQTNIQALNEGLVKKYGELKDVRYVSVKNDNVVNGIEAYTNEHPTDLLVVFTHKRLFYERLFDRSISRELAFESKVALLVLKSE